MGFWDRLGLLSRAEFTRKITNLEVRMGAREDAAYEKLNTTIGTVRDGWAALQAENRVLREQLVEADEQKQQAVQDALTADSDVDAAKVESADSALTELLDVAEPEQPA